MLPETVVHVPVDLAKRRAGVAEAKVVRPAFQMPVQLPNQHRDRLEAAASAGQLPQLLPLPLDAFSDGSTFR